MTRDLTVRARDAAVKGNRVGFDGSPVSNRLRSKVTQDYVLGHSQSSLRDWFRWECIPRTNVLGCSQPSSSTSSGQALRDSSPYPQKLICFQLVLSLSADRKTISTSLTLNRPLRRAQGGLYGTDSCSQILTRSHRLEYQLILDSTH